MRVYDFLVIYLFCKISFISNSLYSNVENSLNNSDNENTPELKKISFSKNEFDIDNNHSKINTENRIIYRKSFYDEFKCKTINKNIKIGITNNFKPGYHEKNQSDKFSTKNLNSENRKTCCFSKSREYIFKIEEEIIYIFKLLNSPNNYNRHLKSKNFIKGDDLYSEFTLNIEKIRFNLLDMIKLIKSIQFSQKGASSSSKKDMMSPLLSEIKITDINQCEMIKNNYRTINELSHTADSKKYMINNKKNITNTGIIEDSKNISEMINIKALILNNIDETILVFNDMLTNLYDLVVNTKDIIESRESKN